MLQMIGLLLSILGAIYGELPWWVWVVAWAGPWTLGLVLALMAGLVHSQTRPAWLAGGAALIAWAWMLTIPAFLIVAGLAIFSANWHWWHVLLIVVVGATTKNAASTLMESRKIAVDALERQHATT